VTVTLTQATWVWTSAPKTSEVECNLGDMGGHGGHGSGGHGGSRAHFRARGMYRWVPVMYSVHGDLGLPSVGL
jgi:hypothetical protein